MNITSIEWTATPREDGTMEPGFSANPLKYRNAAGEVVWGCVKKSPGCANCYSETIATRWNRGGPFTVATMNGLTPFIDEKELRSILTSKKLAGKKVFVGDMTDCFGDWVPFELLDRMFAAFALRPDVTFQILTKRPERMRDYFTAEGGFGRWGFIEGEARKLAPSIPSSKTLVNLGGQNLPNCWLGTSVEDQKRADERIPHLLRTPAAVRFLSCEPLIGAVDLGRWLYRWDADGFLGPIDWAIVGGESGAGARPLDLVWVRQIVSECKASGTACFVKQLGSRPLVTWREFQALVENPPAVDCAPDTLDRLPLRNRKGGNPDEWPADLRTREFP